MKLGIPLKRVSKSQPRRKARMENKIGANLFIIRIAYCTLSSFFFRCSASTTLAFLRLRCTSLRRLVPFSAELKSAAKSRGAESDFPESEANKNPENSARFRGIKSNQTRVESISFFYPDCYCRLWNSLAPHCVWCSAGVTSIVLVVCSIRSSTADRTRNNLLAGCTADREFHPAPKVCIKLARL